MSNRTLMRFTGVGGQGVLLAGEIFAAAKISNGGFGLKTATYTSQVRGGPTVVDITLQDEEIIYPYANDGEIDFMLSLYSYQMIFSVTQQVTCCSKCELLVHILASEAISARGKK
jgi:Pyruvate/2-oxoacid:ferredoxin oxidoreductase gamma subunit